jgi:drug/metabolite transporter (DMT)-like permease
VWLFFALCSPFFWAVVHVADAHCVERVFHRPWMGVITSSLASLIVVLVIPFAYPFAQWEMPRWNSAVFFVVAGLLVQISQAFYFQALSHSEAGIVAAYWNMTPALLPAAAFVFVGSVLRPHHYLGIAILIAASIAFCLAEDDRATRWRGLFLMLAASIFQVAALLLMNAGYERSRFFVGFLLTTFGVIAAGSAPLMFSVVRKAFRENFDQLRPALPVVLGIELVNLVALFMSQKALDLGVPSLVAAVETTIPAYTFALALVLLAAAPKFGDERVTSRLPMKLLLVAVMATGVWLVSDGVPLR